MSGQLKRERGREITELEIMTLSHENIEHASKHIEVMFKGELHCLQGCFKKHTGR